MSNKRQKTLKCGTHGDRIASVVCGHMILASDSVVGFVENSSDPNDLQAWCDACERMFLVEQELSEAFRQFNDMSVVCDFCYARLKERHSKLER